MATNQPTGIRNPVQIEALRNFIVSKNRDDLLPALDHPIRWFPSRIKNFLNDQFPYIDTAKPGEDKDAILFIQLYRFAYYDFKRQIIHLEERFWFINEETKLMVVMKL